MDIIKNKPLTELVGGDISSGGGDRNVTNNSEIETGPVQKPFTDDSDYEKGISPTTDKVVDRYVHEHPWFSRAMGNRSGSIGTILTVTRDEPYNQNESYNRNIVTKQSVEETIDDLVKKRENDGLKDKNHNAKFNKVIDSIDDCDFDDKQLEKLKAAVNKKLCTKEKNMNI